MKRTCVQCGNEFTLTNGEISFYNSKNMPLPKRCKACREQNREKKDTPHADDATQEDKKTNAAPAAVPPAGGKKAPAKESGVKRTAGFLFALLAVLIFTVVSARNNRTDTAGDPTAAGFTENPSVAETGTDAEPAQTEIAETQTAVTRGFRTKKALTDHYEKHGIEMGFSSAESYLAAANAVTENPDALHKYEKEDGDDVYFIEATGEIVFVSTDGYLRTYFISDKDYFDRQ